MSDTKLNIEKINEELEKGELLFCPECDLFFPESDTCKIIICTNPFKGPSDLDIDDQIELVTKNFHKFYRETEKEAEKVE